MLALGLFALVCLKRNSKKQGKDLLMLVDQLGLETLDALTKYMDTVPIESKFLHVMLF